MLRTLLIALLALATLQSFATPQSIEEVNAIDAQNQFFIEITPQRGGGKVIICVDNGCGVCGASCQESLKSVEVAGAKVLQLDTSSPVERPKFQDGEITIQADCWTSNGRTYCYDNGKIKIIK